MDIILGKERKRWSEDQKREIVAETVATGEVTSVARRHGANPSMVFGWRKRFLEEQRPAVPPTFMPVALPAPAEQPARAAPETPTIDLAFACGARLRVTGVEARSFRRAGNGKPESCRQIACGRAWWPSWVGYDPAPPPVYAPLSARACGDPHAPV